jgi:signal transduction histidine kinase
MHLSFRHRLFLALIGLGTLPLAAALLVLALQVRSSGSPVGLRSAFDEIAESGSELISALDTTSLNDEGRAAVQAHAEVISRRTSLARRAETLSRYAAGAAGLAIFLVAVMLVVASLVLARRWSKLVSAPIEELVDWVRRTKRREPLPPATASKGAPEFDALRSALRDMATALEDARQHELEQERLRAFRETARRVAHEMRGPLTAARLAVRQLVREDDDAAVNVLMEETGRLERMAREFSDFGRLPEGPEAEVDLKELLENALATLVPPDVPVTRQLATGLTVNGHYEPLRRAVHNLLSNAIDASGKNGLTVEAAPDEGLVRLTIADRGPGIPDNLKPKVFDPYFTTKARGTGLGLALVRQTVTAHGGTIRVQDTAGGGAAFIVELPTIP